MSKEFLMILTKFLDFWSNLGFPRLICGGLKSRQKIIKNFLNLPFFLISLLSVDTNGCKIPKKWVECISRDQWTPSWLPIQKKHTKNCFILKKEKSFKKIFPPNFFEKQTFFGIFWEKNIFLFLGLDLEKTKSQKLPALLW